VDMLKITLKLSERLACKAVGRARSTYRRLSAAQTPNDPDAQMRAWLRAYAVKDPCHGFRRAWATLRYDEHREVNQKRSTDSGVKRAFRCVCAARPQNVGYMWTTKTASLTARGSGGPRVQRRHRGHRRGDRRPPISVHVSAGPGPQHGATPGMLL
jgi:hypothetical protein